MAATLRFVDKIDPARTTRLDLYAPTGPITLLREGTVFEPPPLRRAAVETMLVDGERYPSSAYGNRVLQLALTAGEASADLVAAEVQKLQRELDRPTNILEWQAPDVTTPVFFKTFRSPLDNLREWRYDPRRKHIVVEVAAEPFAYGLRETLPAATVNNNPAAASNGMFLDVTGVKGDVETPAFLSFPVPSWPAGTFTAISARRRGNPANMTHFLQAEAMTQGTDTTTQLNDAAFSGSGNNYSRCTFGTNASLVKRLDVTNWPSGTTRDELRGHYRAYARVRRNTATDNTHKLQLKWGFWTLVANQSVSSWTSTATEFALVDLGLVSFPRAADPVTVGPSGVEIPSYGMHLELHAQRLSGTANLDIDYLLLLPADDALLLIDHAGGAQGDVVLDGHNETVYTRWTTGHVLSMDPWKVAGRFPMLAPGVTNRLFFLRDVNGGGDAIATTTAVTVSYWPRYLYTAAP